nr:cation-transporting P-type ATPase [Patescibacteria group bacterium]
MQKDWYNISAEKAIQKLKTNPEKGLSPSEVKSSRKKHGKNEIKKRSKDSKLKIFLSQFKSPLIFILI